MPKVKRIYIYRDSHLPEIGWLQSCFKCEAITGRYFLFHTFRYKETLYEFYVHTCGTCTRCFKKNPQDYIKFSNTCNKYIKTNYHYLFTSRS